MQRWKSLLANSLAECRLPKGIRRKRCAQPALDRRLAVETLEDRRLLAVITVNSPADNTTVDGLVTLREAVQAANTDASVDGSTSGGGADTIIFAATLSGQTIRLGGTEIAITEALTIDASALAASLTVNAQQNSRIFNITAATGDFMLAGLTLTGGRTIGSDTLGVNTNNGGAVRLLTTGNLTVDRSTISGSSTAGEYAAGGGIYTVGTLALVNSTVSGNSTTGYFATGGGIEALGSVTLTNSTMSGNSTSGNYAAGGGVVAHGDLTLTNSTVSGNSTSGRVAAGGGVFADGNVTLNQSTVTNNQATMSNGGGIYQSNTLNNRPLAIDGSIVAGNRVGGGSGPDMVPDPDSDLTVNASLIGVADGLTILGNLGGLNQTGLAAVPLDPLLGPLANNGGLTQTHALLPGSPAIDAGDPTIATPPANDQRGAGFARVLDGNNDGTAVIDMGAFETEPPPEVTLSGGVLAFNDVSSPEVDDFVTISLAGPNLLIRSNNTIRSNVGGSMGSGSNQVSVPLAGITQIDVNTMAGNDRLTIDYAGGFIFQNINFNGGNPTSGPGDSLVITGGTAVNTTLYTFTNQSDGSIAMDFAGGGTDSTIAYTGLEPIADHLNAANRLFAFNGGAEIIALSDDGVAGDNSSIINSTLGESISFVNPTNSLTINAGSGADVVNVTGTDTMTVIPSLIINGGDGTDTISVLPSLTSITVHGDLPVVGDAEVPPGDRLVIALPDGVTLDNNPATPDGTAMLTGAANVMFTSIEQLVVVAADALENNNMLAAATLLGSPAQVTVNKLSIHQPGDVDFFKLIAPESGKLMVNLFFDHTIGDLDLEVQDRFGNVIDTSSLSSSDLFSEQIVIPVVDQEMVFVRVFGVGGAFNNYDLALQHRIAPTPAMPTLHPDDDSGSSDADHITEVTDPRVLVQADLADFAAMGIPMLTAAEAAAGLMPGAAIEVFSNGVSQGFAERVGTSATLFLFTFDPAGLANGLPVSGGVLNYVTAAVRIFDGQRDAAGGDPAMVSGRTQFSERLALRTVDTTGPQVSSVSIPGFVGFDLFAAKPSNAGPTPAINQLEISFTDLPVRGGIFVGDPLEATLAENPAFYSLVGDATGPIAIQSATVATTSSTAGDPATATVRLTFVEFLPDDRFTFIVRDNITDPAGNALDGESDGTQPAGGPASPSGDGVPGGDFVVRFTVDTRPEIGVWSAGTALIDTNGNFLFDPENSDASNGDIAYQLGFSSDNIFAGNFSGPGPDMMFGTADDQGAAAGDGIADRFDKLAAYGRVGNQWRWMIDRTNDGLPDLIINEPMNINGIPVAGNFDGNVANGDEVGVFDGTSWFFDTNHDFQLDAGSVVPSFGAGFPIVGDFDDDGRDDLGNYTAVANSLGGNRFSINLRNATPIIVFQVGMAGNLAAGGFNGFAGVRERPVAADMNADGMDDIGLWVPDGSALVPGNQGEWYFLVSGDVLTTPGVVETSVLSRIDDGFVAFTATPFGNDSFARFGNGFAVPLLGNFDPPLVAGTVIAASAPLTPPIAGQRPLVGEFPRTEGATQGVAKLAPIERTAVDPVEETVEPFLDPAAVPIVEKVVAEQTVVEELVRERAVEETAAPVAETVSLAAVGSEELPVGAGPIGEKSVSATPGGPKNVEPAADAALQRPRDEEAAPLDQQEAADESPQSPAAGAAINSPQPRPAKHYFSRISWLPSVAGNATQLAATSAKTAMLHVSSPKTGKGLERNAVDPNQSAPPDSETAWVRPAVQQEVPISTAGIRPVVEVSNAKATTAPPKSPQKSFSRANWGYGAALANSITTTQTETESIVVATPQVVVHRVADSMETTAARSTATTLSSQLDTSVAPPSSTIHHPQTAPDVPSQPKTRVSETPPDAAEAARPLIVHPLQNVNPFIFSTADDTATQHQYDFVAKDRAFHEEAGMALDSEDVEPPIGQTQQVTDNVYRAEAHRQMMVDLALELAVLWSE